MRRVAPFAACLLISSIASATVLVPAEFTEIVRESQIIAHARIVDVRPQWADGRRWIDSVVTAEVVSSLKGDADGTLAFKVPGGQLGRYRSVVVGAPVFTRGDEAILFLKSRGDELPDVFGLNQGVFRIRVDARTGQRMVVPPPVMKVDTSPEPQRVVRGALDRRPMILAAFGAKVREVMAARIGAAPILPQRESARR
jgi:hypothetical protein